MRTELGLPCGGGREALANEGFVAACASERGERAINNATLLLMGAGQRVRRGPGARTSFLTLAPPVHFLLHCWRERPGTK